MSIIEKLLQFLSPNDKPPVTSNAPSPEIVATASSQPAPVDLIAIDEQRIREDFWEAMRAIVRAHGKALQIKRAQLVSADAYGNSIQDKFDMERDYFIKNVMYRDVPPHLLEFLVGPSHLEMGRGLFAQGLEWYEMLTGHTVPSVKVSPDLSGVEYEQYCLQELRAAGWTATSTKASGDQGIDLIATTESITVVGQCKFYSNPVGNSAVQEAIAGREFQKADYAFVVTNSTFTPSARSLAVASNVLLLHHSELCDLATKLDISVRKPAHLPEREPLSLPNTSRPLPDILREGEELMAKLKTRELGYEDGEDDPLYNQAVQIVLVNKRASISLVQRNLRIGYNRAARLIEDMEAKGLVSPTASDGSRKLLR